MVYGKRYTIYYEILLFFKFIYVLITFNVQIKHASFL